MTRAFCRSPQNPVRPTRRRGFGYSGHNRDGARAQREVIRQPSAEKGEAGKLAGSRVGDNGAVALDEVPGIALAVQDEALHEPGLSRPALSSSGASSSHTLRAPAERSSGGGQSPAGTSSSTGLYPARR